MTKPKLVVLFGEMGAGKNYYGKIIADLRGVPFVDGDDFLPPDLKYRVSQHKPLTTGQVDRFVHLHLIPGIERALAQNPRGIVLAQALYRNYHRRLLMRMFDVEFHWVRPTHIRHARNLAKREKPVLWFALALLSKAWFEVPDFACKHIIVSQ